MAKEKTKSSQPKKKHPYLIRNLLSTLLAIIALTLLFYPLVVNYFVAQQNLNTVQRYNQSVSKIGKTKAERLLADARLYNAKLYNEYIYDASQNIPWQGKVPDYNSELKVDSSGLMGYISIPQIAVNDVPIYHGDSETTLAVGVGHIPQTSLPIGGVNTHAVLPAHSGRVNNTLFTDLDMLKLGDVFYINVLNEKLKYEVDNIKVVNPKDVSSLGIIKGKDLVTLVTCYPTGINNKRLLVTGERIPLSKVTPSEKIERNKFGYNFWVMLAAGIIALLALLSLLFWLLAKRQRLYQVYPEKLEQPSLEQATQPGAFGQGFYLTNHRKVAESWASELYPDEPELYLNIYRLKKLKSLSRWVFKSKSENWKNYQANAAAADFVDTEHELVAGPIDGQAFRTGKRISQYRLNSSEALEHLKHLKSKKIERK